MYLKSIIIVATGSIAPLALAALPCTGLNQAREWHKGGVTSTGIPFVVGGRAPKGPHDFPLASLELFSKETNSWKLYPLLRPRMNFAVTPLSDGRIFISAGSKSQDNEIFDPSVGTSTLVAPSDVELQHHVALQISSNEIMVTGPTIQFYSASTGKKIREEDAPDEFYGVLSAVLVNGQAVINAAKGVFVYNGTTRKWRFVKGIPYNRDRANLLQIGNTNTVLITGGMSQVSGYDGQTLVLDLSTETFIMLPSIPELLHEHQGAFLNFSEVVYGGGVAEKSAFFSFDLYSGIWTKLKAPRLARSGSYSFLYDNSYFVTGGWDHTNDTGALKSVEIYSTQTKTWTYCN